MASLSFCISSPPQTLLPKQSKSTLFSSISSSSTHPFSHSIFREFSTKPISLSRRFPVIVLNSTSGESEPVSPAKKLREILQSPGILQGPCCFDALSAKLIERAGFPFSITTGFSIAAARLGLPEKGLVSYGEMVDQGRLITQSVSIPVIGDGGNGFGNVMNVKRTVKGYIKAGFAGIIINDGDVVSERRVVSREEAVMRIRAAVDARRESGCDIVIVAQTDSREVMSLEESISRARAFTDAGADVLSVDCLGSREEMKSFCSVYPLVPKLANMLESGGKIPVLNPLELEEIGYKLVAYPISLIGVSIQAMQDALVAIKGGRVPSPGSMPSLKEIEGILGSDTYNAEAERYTTSKSDRGASGSSVYGSQRVAQDEPKQREDPVIEVITPEVYNEPIKVVTPEVYNEPRNPFSDMWSRSLRVKIIGRDGSEKLDIRIPAGFLEGVTNIVPALGGVNLKQLMDNAADEPGGKLLLDFKDTAGDRIQVFLE